MTVLRWAGAVQVAHSLHNSAASSLVSSAPDGATTADVPRTNRTVLTAGACESQCDWMAKATL